MTNLYRTSLFDKHVELNAKMVPFAGWEMPIQYTSVKEEVLAVRQSVGVFDVSHMGEFFVEGEEAQKFLDFILPNDIGGAENNKAIYSPLCREDGTIVDDLIVYKFNSNKFLICVNASNIDKDFDFMKKIATEFKCSFKNLSNDYSLLAVQGPRSFEVLTSILGIKDIPYYSFYPVENVDNVYVARTGYTGEDGFEIFGSHKFIGSLWPKLLQKGVIPCGLAARDVLRTEVAYPLYGHELSDEVTPLDSALKWTIKFDKPNFLCKNALANLKPKYSLIKIILENGIPRPGYTLFNQNDIKVGEVTSGTMSVQLNKGIALVRVDANLFRKDDQFSIDIRGKKYPAHITTKAFVQGGHK